MTASTNDRRFNLPKPGRPPVVAKIPRPANKPKQREAVAQPEADRSISPRNQSEFQTEKFDPVSNGQPFVRMLSPCGTRVAPIAISYNFGPGVGVDGFVQNYLDGWRFIEGEPVLPRTSGDPDKPEAQPVIIGGERRFIARMSPTASSPIEVFNIWMTMIAQDVRKYADRVDLDLDAAKLVSMKLQAIRARRGATGVS